MKGAFIGGSDSRATIEPVLGRMRILVVEDERKLQEQLASALGREGYAVDGAADGEEGQALAQIHEYDAIILDLGLPLRDGLSVLRSWRKQEVRAPVLILTARSSWHEKVEGIDAGADDYLAKPFQMQELLARVRALIRRSSGQVAPELHAGPLSLDTRSGTVTLEGAIVPLTANELKVLSYLMHHGGRVVPRMELVEHIYSQDFDRDSNTIEVFIARLRRKIGVSRIRTFRGLGYRLEAE